MKIDVGYITLNKFGEQLCGDNIALLRGDNTTITLADGLGSGVKANILSILTSKIMSTMLANNVSIEECVETIADTLPVCKEREVAYSTFTSICVNDNGVGYMLEYDNPEAILVRGNKCYDLDREKLTIYGKNIYQTKLNLLENDYIVVMSDGATMAGVGITLNDGWSRKSIMEHMDRHLKEGMTAMEIALLVESACSDLYLNEPSDDTSCMVIGLVKEQTATVMIGPPSKVEVDNQVAKLLVDSDGYKIVCGGTTAKLVSRYLNKNIDMNYSVVNESIPPISHIEGIDLVTEGAITIAEVVKRLEVFNNPHTLEDKKFDDLDGASLLLNYLLKSTEINLLIGQTINVANKNSTLDVEDKQKNIRLLIKYLKQAGKVVNAKFY